MLMVAWRGGGRRDEEKSMEVRFMVLVNPTGLANGFCQGWEGKYEIKEESRVSGT